jgi:hypothetical protein
MLRMKLAMSLLSVSLLAGAGCGWHPRDNTDVLLLVGLDGSNAFYRHFERLEPEDWTRSSLWSVDLESRQCRRITKARRFQGLVAEGDYYVFDKFDSPVDSGAKLWGVQVSTQEEFEILTATTGLGHYGSYVLMGTRVAVLSGAELVHYDLAERDVVGVFPVPDETRFVLDMHEDRALLQGWGDEDDIPTEGDSQEERELPDAWLALLDLADGTVSQMPPYYDSRSSVPIYVKMSGGWVVVCTSPTATEGNVDQIVRGYNISSREWKDLAVYHSEAAWPSPLGMALTLVAGANENFALVERIILGLDWDRAVVELIELESGERSQIGDVKGEMLFVSSLDSLLAEERVYWIDPMNRELVIHELATGTKRTLDLEYSEP